jgi:enoyl-[acyl-carrier protein] reductase II
MHPKAKEISLKATVEDTICSEKIDGLPGRWLKSPAAIKMAEGKPPFLRALASALQIKRMIDTPIFKLFLGGLKQRGVQALARQAVSISGLKVAIDNGDLETGVLPMSQAIGLIKDIPTCKEVIERTVAEAEELLESVRAKITS